MKKLLVFFTIVALMTLSIFAQWEELTHGDELLEEFSYLTYGTGFMLDVDNGWFVGDNGLIIKTTNGGATWTTLRDDDGSGLDWLDVQFYDANTGYACGEKGYILKTVDGGANWDMVGDTANYKENLLYLKVIDANTVFFAGENATLLKTGDGGVNFVKSDNTFEGLKLDGGIDFCNANVGVVASKDVGGYTWYTHDGGANWNLVDVNAESSPAPGQSTYSIQGVGAGGDSTIVLALKYRIILVSQDGGKSYTWKGDYTFANDYYYEASVIDKNTFFVSGNGLTVRTTDGGATWDSLAVGTAYRVMFMNFFDTNTGFVICEKNQWKKTTDGGDTFTPIIEWPDVDFRAVGATSSTIFVTGFNGGEITSSNDGGITWTWPTNEMTGAIGSLLKCEFYDDNNGITAGNGGQLYRTSDGGASWTLIYNPMYYIGKTIYTITYHSSDTVFAGGSSGYLMRSVDGGLTWSDTYLSGTTKSNYGILPLSGSTAIVCGASGYLYKAEFLDNSTVDDSLYNTFTDDDFNAVVSFGDSLILLTDEGAILKAAIDNLSTFKRIEIDAATDELNDIEFVNDTLVFVAGKSGKIYRSEDTGNTWTADTSPTTETIYDILYTNYALWGETNYGAIIKLDFTPPITELVGDYYIPKGSNAQGFATLGEAVTAANTLDVIGTVNFLLDADTLREASFTFNADLSAENNVVIKPASGRDVVLIVAPGVSKGNGPQMIGFDKGYVTIDGSNDGSDSRNLIITNEVVADVPIGLNTANADMVVLKNLIIKNLDNGVSNFKYGAVTNDVAGIEGFTVENCQIGSAEFPVWRDGVAVWGTSSGSTQGIVLNNDIYAGSRGIATYVVNDCNFSGNTIYMLPTTSATTYSYVHGIYLTGASGPMTIHGNTINCLEAATVSGTYIVGIAFAGNSEGAGEIISVVNNMVNVGAADGTHPTYGIGFRSANNMGNIQAYYNTILLNDNASTSANYAVGNHTNGTGPVTLDLVNNIIINNHSGSTESSAIGLIPTTSVLTADYNVLVSNQNFVNYQGTSYADLTAWQATGKDVNSVSKAVTFAGDTDLHLAGSSIGDVDLVGSPIAEITMDIDGDTRSTTLPYKGADESDEIVLSIDQNVDIMPESFKLHQNYPNPFNPTTTIAFDLPEAANVKLVVYNMMGQQVATLKNENMQPGFYNVNFDASRLASGVYIYRIEANRFSALKKMTIMK